jgi:hypothetical protein
MPAEELVATLRQAWDVLGELQVPAALVGGLALAHWGYVRSTQDVDLLVALSGVRPSNLLARLGSAGYRTKRSEPLIRLDDVECLQLFYSPPGALLEIQIDLLLADSPFYRQALERRVVVSDSALGFPLAVVSCEDLIILKLIAGRVRDRLDAGELMKFNRNALDLSYLTQCIRQLNLPRAFAEAWSDAFPGSVPPA